ncbi:unnamed protein product [Agarophyton chilense]
MVCRANGLEVDHVAFETKLKPTAARFVKPEFRIDAELSFPFTQRVAPRKIRRWMKHGSIVPWVEGLASRAGPPERDTFDGYLSREILAVGMALAALLDEFHPLPIIFSAGVERLVKRSLVFEEAWKFSRKERGAFYKKKLAFMGLGGGALPSTGLFL